MRERLLKIMMESMHIVLIFAIVFPAVYMFGMSRTNDMEYRLYLCNFLVLLPVFLIKSIVFRCKRLGQYMIYCIALFGITTVMAAIIAGTALPEELHTGYMLIVLTECFIVMALVYAVRQNKAKHKKALEEEDRQWEKKTYSLEKPSPVFVIWFTFIYVTAKNFDCASVCNLSLFSTIVYILLAAAYHYMDKTEQYLISHQSVCNIPKRRIYAIGKVFLIIYVLILLIAAIPAIGMIKNRTYKDFRQWVKERGDEAEALMDEEKPEEYGADPMQDVMALYGEPKQAPVWVGILFYAILGSVLLSLLIAFVKMIKEQLVSFRHGNDDNGDKAEMLNQSSDREERIRGGYHRDDENVGSVRRQYRKMIRKNRKDMPKPAETPSEIEAKAGLAAHEEMKELHNQYETVRYGR